MQQSRLILPFLLSIFLLTVIPAISSASFPKITPYINDFTGMLDATCESNLESISNQIHSNTTAELAVVIMPTIGDSDINEYSNAFFRDAGLGDRNKNNGLLVLIVMDTKSYRIETGYGLEGDLPDALVSRLANDHIRPSIDKDDLCNGTTGLLLSIADQLGVTINPAYITIGNIPMSQQEFILLAIVFIIVVIILIKTDNLELLFILAGRGSRGSYGGGSSGGGGASG